MRSPVPRPSSPWWGGMGRNTAAAVLFAAAALGNLYLFLSSAALYSYTTQTPLERAAAGGPSSTAELTKFWMFTASRAVLDGADGDSEAALSVHGLGARPFDPAGKINAWDIYPPEVSCPDVMRVGNVGDGGKFVCGLSWMEQHKERPCVVYSYGISTDTSFEHDLAAKAGCTIYGFDPTVGEMKMDLSRGGAAVSSDQFVFHKTALSTKSGSSAEFALSEHLYDTMVRLNHSYIDILKVDVEGSEWTVMNDLLGYAKSPLGGPRFGQLLIELHFRTALELDRFMSDMRGSGYVSFSREINLIPTLKGDLPLATEYSFINPDLFFSAGRQLLTAPQPRDLRWQSRINAVIYILTHSRRVEKLSETLHLIYHNAWKQFPYYPVIIFHDDLNSVHKSVIQDAVPHMPLKFISVTFRLPELFQDNSSEAQPTLLRGATNTTRRFHASDVPERTLCSALSSTIGYRHMIRFHATQVHSYLSKLTWRNSGQLEYIWRLDDDSYITHPIGYDVFRFMKANSMKYGFVNMVKDDPLCIRGLWDHAAQFFNNTVSRESDKNWHNRSFFLDLDEGAVFYNNFEVSSAALWRDPRWVSYMESVDATGNIYLERWGDAPLHTVGVAMLLAKENVHKFSDIGYRHDPFIYRPPSGQPRPGLDPLRSDDSICVFYEEWVCTRSHLLNVTNSSRVYANMGVSLPAWAIAAQPEHISSAEGVTGENETPAGEVHDAIQVPSAERHAHVRSTKDGVLWTFMDKGMEKELAGTLNSFYENYAKARQAPFVVFYEGPDIRSSRNTRVKKDPRDGIQQSKLELMLSAEILKLLTLVPVDLLHLNKSLECASIAATEPSNKLSHWLCNRSDVARGGTDSVPPCPQMRCIGQNSTDRQPSRQNNYLMTVSAFLTFRANNILINMGFSWMWRFSLASRLLQPVTYDMFERLSSGGKRYAFISVVQEQRDCVNGIWSAGLDICNRREATDCRGLINRWPVGVVILTNFAISHRSVWESSIHLELLSTLLNAQASYSDAHHERDHTGDAKTLWWWKDPVVHTVSILLSLTVTETMKLTNFPYQLVDVSDKKVHRRKDFHIKDYEHQNSQFRYKHESIHALDKVFRAQRFGWLGADVAASLALPGLDSWRAHICSQKSHLRRSSSALLSICDSHGKTAGSGREVMEQYIWLFGDTVIGTSSKERRLEGIMVPNSVALAVVDTSATKPERRLTQLKYFWGAEFDGIPREMFQPPDVDMIMRSANATLSRSDGVDVVKYWPLSGVSVVDLSSDADSTSQLSGEDLLLKACKLLVLGHVIMQNSATSSKMAPDVDILLGAQAFDFSILQTAVAVVSNPYSPPNMWVYDWRLIPKVHSKADTISFEWFSMTSASSMTGATGALSVDYLYMVGVCIRSTTFKDPYRAAENQSFLEAQTETIRYNVLGRVRVRDILSGEFDVNVMGRLSNTSHDISGTWMSVYGPSDVMPVRCFPFDGVATQWIFVAMIMIENALEICRMDVAQTDDGHNRLLDSCAWQCEVVRIIDKSWLGRPNIMSYAGRLHRELSPRKSVGGRENGKGKELIISYVPNVVGEPQELFLDVNSLAYTPKFVSVTIDGESVKKLA